MSLMRIAVLQKRMALDILTASQGGTCAIIQTECCVFIPDQSSNVSSLLKHMKKQVNAISDPPPSLDLFAWLCRERGRISLCPFPQGSYGWPNN